MALNIKDLGVKFYSSKTRQEALSFNESSSEPAAICFVSDSLGNSIILNGKIFGDGAKSSGGGTISSASDIIIVEKDGQILKTLSDYFDEDGKIITDSLIIKSVYPSGEIVENINISSSGILINGKQVATQDWVTSQLSGIQTNINTAEANAKKYTDEKLSSVYKFKGSVDTYQDLPKENLIIGDVYNVVASYNKYPSGTNFAWTSQGWDALGGSITIEGYITEEQLNAGITQAINTSKDYTDSQLLTIESTITNINTSIDNVKNNLQKSIDINAKNIATNATNIETNTQNITQISTQLTWQ